MRLIDADKAIKEIIKYRDSDTSDLDFEIGAVNKCIRIVEKQETVNKWINVNDKLPKEEDEWYLCYSRNRQYVAEYLGDGEWRKAGGGLYNPEAWMPLPEKYKK